MSAGFQSDSWLPLMACLIGVAVIALNVPCALSPRTVRGWLQAFPRCRSPAWLLTGVDLAWVAWIIYHAQLGRFEGLKPWLYVATPVSFLLLVLFMDELLAPRALGGFLLLLANPVIRAARWHDSDWRLVPIAIAYLWAVAGMLLVLSPYYFRRIASWMTLTDARCRRLGLLRIGVGLGLILLGLFVY